MVVTHSPLIFSFYGLLGFVAFECLQIRLCLWSKTKIIPFESKSIYFVITMALAICAGFLAVPLSNGTSLGQIYVGISFPSIVKMAIPKSGGDESRTGIKSEDEIGSDDTSIEFLDSDMSFKNKVMDFVSRWLYFFKLYFIR